MENKLDKLFRDKLEQHAVAASAHAWEKVAAGFPKKNNAPVWAWRIAAAITLVGVITWYDFDGTQPANQLQVANEKPAVKKQENVKLDKRPVEEKTNNQEQPSAAQTPVLKRTPTPFRTNSVAKAVVETQTEPAQEFQPVEMIASVEEVIEPMAVIEKAAPTKKEKAMVIVFNLAPVEGKQEVEPAKVNGFKRVIDFAKEVKGGETTLATARHWKDNFFGSEEQTRADKQTHN